jgi:cytochrome c-type biogenesis protein
MSAVDSPSLLAAFAAGTVSFISPCVLPLVPGYLSLISGMQRTDLGAADPVGRRRVVLSAALFVLGFSIVFVALGAAASFLGALVGPYRLALGRAAGGLIIVMGLVVAGIFRPLALLQERRFHLSPAALGPYAAPVMGMAFAFGWTPCIGPVLASVLTLAAGRDTLNQGVLLLVGYSVGLGVPFLVMAAAFDRFGRTWMWLKRHGRAIDMVSGAVLVVFGALLLTSQMGRMASSVAWLWRHLGLDRLTVG